MLANAITLCRLFLTFVVIALFRRYHSLDFMLIAVIALIFVLDAVDGSVARKRNETTETGALLDTTADRKNRRQSSAHNRGCSAAPLYG